MSIMTVIKMQTIYEKKIWKFEEQGKKVMSASPTN